MSCAEIPVKDNVREGRTTLQRKSHSHLDQVWRSFSGPKVIHGIIDLPSYYIFSNEKMTDRNTFTWKKQIQKVYILGMVSISNWPSWSPVYSVYSLVRPVAIVMKTSAWLGCTHVCTCVCFMGMFNAVCGSVPQSVHCVSMASGEHRQGLSRWTNQSLILGSASL